MELVDSHCHLDAGEFDGDRDAVVRRARTAGVTRQIVPAVDAAGWPKLRDVCRADAGLFPAYGLHPIALSVHRPEHLQLLRDWVERERPVVVQFQPFHPAVLLDRANLFINDAGRLHPRSRARP